MDLDELKLFLGALLEKAKELSEEKAAPVDVKEELKAEGAK